MRKRPINTFLCVMRQEEPSESRKLINTFKRGGIEIEECWKEHLRGINKTFPYVAETGKNKGEYGNWLYVGNTWWCRKTKKYEFARLVAIEKVGEKEIINGLWDTRKHSISKPPCWVYKEGKRGIIVGYNKYEIVISWESSTGRNIFLLESMKSLDGVTFEFEEDFRKYIKIASKLVHWGKR